MILHRQGPQRTCWSDRCTLFRVKTFSMSLLMMRRTSSISDLLRNFIHNTYLIWASAYSYLLGWCIFSFGCLIWWCLSVDLQMLHQHFIPGCSPCSHVLIFLNSFLSQQALSSWKPQEVKASGAALLWWKVASTRGGDGGGQRILHASLLPPVSSSFHSPYPLVAVPEAPSSLQNPEEPLLETACKQLCSSQEGLVIPRCTDPKLLGF